MSWQWWKRRQTESDAALPVASDASHAASEGQALVEYSEFVLVLSPEPLWPRWKKTDSPPTEE